MHRSSFSRPGPTRTNARGFTLVELMVALTGGLVMSLAVFALARDSGRFYQRESRIANATVGGLLGFERLRTDIARTGFLSSPNIVRDTTVCSHPVANWPTALRSLSSIFITQPATSTGALAANGRNPPVLRLSGSYSSADAYPARIINTGGGNVVFQLVTKNGAYYRLGNGTDPTNAAMLAVFAVGRTLRYTQVGEQYYGQITASTGFLAGAPPTVTVNSAPPMQFRAGAPNNCGIDGGLQGPLGVINVVNFIEYSIRNLSTGAQTAQAATDYASLYANSAAGPGESTRTELVRVEKDIFGNVVNGTEEVVAEYAVDLGLQINAITGVTGCCEPAGAIQVLPTAAGFASYTGDVFNSVNTPEWIRTVRVRLGVRSREGDRDAALTADATATALQGLYRFNIGGTPAAYARVRTFQADVALRNQMDVVW